MTPASYWLSIILSIDETDPDEYDKELLRTIQEIQRVASNDALMKVEKTVVELINFQASQGADA